MVPSIELLGYLASALVAVSLMMRSVVRLRLVNLVGALCFSAYGFLIGALPVAGMNALIAVINVVYLAKLLRSGPEFRVIDVRPEEGCLRAFLDFHEKDIARFFPPSAWRPLPADVRAFLILRDAAPIGVVLGRPTDERTLRIDVDYVIVDYRDLKPGRHFYGERAPLLSREGLTRLVADTRHHEHASYLRKVGFAPAGDGSHFERPLTAQAA
ncbi:MAG: hypothetical protein U0441_17895 [Polyangiaceae bacterium]